MHQVLSLASAHDEDASMAEKIYSFAVTAGEDTRLLGTGKVTELKARRDEKNARFKKHRQTSFGTTLHATPSADLKKVALASTVLSKLKEKGMPGARRAKLEVESRAKIEMQQGVTVPTLASAPLPSARDPATGHANPEAVSKSASRAELFAMRRRSSNNALHFEAAPMGPPGSA